MIFYDGPRRLPPTLGNILVDEARGFSERVIIAVRHAIEAPDERFAEIRRQRFLEGGDE